jgi:phosphatidylglycerol:prolipoprotein diacylglycerol transferase
MYPRISDLFRDLFGLDLPLPLYSFGLMVATAILTATWLARKELDRMYAAGQIGPVEIKEPGKGGRTKIVKESPSAIMWNVMLLAAVFGVIGSKLFHIIDFWDRFVQDPAGMIFSTGGLTIYGGLIVGGLAIWLYARRKDIHFGALADAIAPGLMLAYGIGRIGCYLAGDGDWGKCSDLADKPAFLPDFLWSETFPRNILDRDLVAECGGAFDGVYPTMLYEFAMAAVLAGVLWALRKHTHQFGWLFSLYLVFNGIERFLIEQIRVNPELSWIGLTQAMLIALLFVAAGIGGMIMLWKRRTREPQPASAS